MPVLLGAHAPQHGPNPVDLPGHAAGYPHTVDRPGHGQAEAVGQPQGPGGVLAPEDPGGGAAQLRPAPQHGRQAEQQSQQGHGQDREKDKMEQVPHVQDLAQIGQ